MSLPMKWQECPGCRGAMLPGAARCSSCGHVVAYCSAPSCQKPIYRGERTLSFTSGTAEIGEKSKMIFEERTDDVITIIHYGCVIANFKPEEDRITFDAYADRYGALVREDIKEQVRAELEKERDQAVEQEIERRVAEIAEGKICAECYSSFEEEETEQQPANGYAPNYAPLASYPTR